ncbi:MAG: carboxypeptidase-like regulatory domain-containing protein [Salinivirgaceae bacterium]|nr:carboxypeptidase-like regulatory domain-containing protein [Salinivirgaceae bacterium]
MNLLKRLSVAFGILLVSSAVFAQGRVSGVVKDRHGEPLIGANVYVKGTTISTISGLNGDFNINAPDSSSVIVITFNGYQNLEVPVRDLATANLQLKPVLANDFEGFYGNDSYYNLTTANTLIMTDDVATGLETDVYQFMLGRIPGLEIVSDGGNPWGNVDYRLRGGHSPTSDNKRPLFVVDGAYFDEDFAINALNPNDIESIRVLKDATATAPYGDMGSNGVVLITTRHAGNKTLSASYDGNVSYNIANNDADNYGNSISTKHNASVAGVAGPMPYRASLGYNAINGTMEKTGSDRLSASFWVGPNLLDEHLKINANGYFRKVDHEYYENLKFSNFQGTLKADYSVHSFEDLHVNLMASYATSNSKMDNGDEKSVRMMYDGNISLAHEFENKNYIELKAGARLSDNNQDDHASSALYGQFNTALGRFLLNANARYNMYSDFNNMSGAISIGVRPVNDAVLHVGVGILGLTVGDKPKTISKFQTATYNLGIDYGNPKKRVYSSVNFYIHYNNHKYSWSMDDEYYNDSIVTQTALQNIPLTNVGGELALGVKILNFKNVKWRIGANAAYNTSFTSDRSKYNEYLSKNGNPYVVGDKPMTYNVYESVYDDNGKPIPGLYVDKGYLSDGKIDWQDRDMSNFSPLPTVIAGLNTYFEAMGAYLQIDSHASLDRYNIVPGQPDLYCSADIHNSSFLRIDDIVLGYKIRNLGMLSGRAYLAVQNPYVFTKYTGDEPEIYDGIDFGKEENYQRPTIFSVGVKLNINIKD